MKIGQRVYTLDLGKVKTGIIVSRAWRWENVIPYREYIVREVKDISTIGLANMISGIVNGTPESLTMHTSRTVFKFNPEKDTLRGEMKTVQSEEASEDE